MVSYCATDANEEIENTIKREEEGNQERIGWRRDEDS
jgi:hypothetical protein